MKWIIEPLAGFAEATLFAADQCSNGGTLNSCNCTGGLLSCASAGALTIKPSTN